MTRATFRFERIEKLLQELHYEVTRGMMENEIDETLSFDFIVPISRAIPDGIVHCSFRTRPAHRHIAFDPDMNEPRLRLVKP